ncbi:MAG: hypothetical protein EXR72_16335 [Myxococcales bacterium]|nr:hypothetical protein [Myxococcales bacterium]
MRFHAITLALAGLLASGCKGSSAIFVTVAAEPGMIQAIERLRVTVTNGGQTADPVDVPLSGSPVTIPPAQTFTLLLAGSRSGSTTIEVAALDLTRETLVKNKGTLDVKPGGNLNLRIVLAGVVSATDLGIDGPPVDAAVPPDQAVQVDAGVPDGGAPDLAIAPDLVATPDLKEVPDLTETPDLTEID